MRITPARQFPSFPLLTALLVAGFAVSGLRADAVAVTTAMTTALTTPLPLTVTAGVPSPLTVTAAAAASPTANLAQAPGRLEGDFEVLTGTGSAPVPAVHLEWDPSEAGDYLIRGYRVYRSSAGSQNFQRRPEGAAGDGEDTQIDDPVAFDQAYDYVVAAVDSKGREGVRSPITTVDMRKVPRERLAPPAPEDLSATSRKEDVKLAWRKSPDWISPWSAYRVYRATSVAGLSGGFLVALTSSVPEAMPLIMPIPGTPQASTVTSQNWNSFADFSKSGSGAGNGQPTTYGVSAQAIAAQAASATAQAGTFTAQSGTFTAQALPATAQSAAALAAAAAVAALNKDYFFYYDKSGLSKTDYFYGVTALDQSGHESPMSLTGWARATGPLPPSRPQALTAAARTEQVILNWQAAAPGTADISGYILNRRPADSEVWRKVALLGVSVTSYSDSLDGGQGYIYRLAAFDALGSTGVAAYVGASPTAKALNNTLILTMPTAYANNLGRDSGVNLNVIFDFYVGSLFESYSSPITGQSQSSIFQRLEIGTVTGDFKYAFFDDRGFVPGFAVGLYTTALIGFGGNSQTVGISSSGGQIDTLGDVYAVFSKRFMPSNPGAVVHVGIMHGNLSQDLTQEPIPSWAWPTIHHLTPTGSSPYLLTSFVDPSLGQTIGQSPNLTYFGLQFPFTVPLGFTRWRSGLRIEALFPMAWEANYPDLHLPTLQATAAATLAEQATERNGAASQLPYLVNIHIDNLPLFGFEFGFFKFDGGYELIAFYHIPDLAWSW